MVFLAERLASDSYLKDVIKRVIRLLFSAEFANACEIECDALIGFDPAEISRGRLLVDAGYMLYQRHRNAREMVGGCYRYLMIDSSPQYGRDFELLLVKYFLLEMAPQLLRWLETLWNNWERNGEGEVDISIFGDEEIKLREKDVVNNIDSNVIWHTPPATQIGFGASSLSDRLRSAAHSLRLDVFTYEALRNFILEFLCCLSDMGTEFGLSRILPVKDLCAIWEDQSPLLASHLPRQIEDDLLQDDVVEDDLLNAGDNQPNEINSGVQSARRICEEDLLELAVPDGTERPPIEFRMIGNDGILHAIHNASQELGKTIPGYIVAVGKLRAACSIVSSSAGKKK
jgi:hypothetical protein